MSDEEFHYLRVLEVIGGSAIIAWFATSIRAFTQILRNTVTLNRVVDDAKAHDAKLDKLADSVIKHHASVDMLSTRGKPDEE